MNSMPAINRTPTEPWQTRWVSKWRPFLHSMKPKESFQVATDIERRSALNAGINHNINLTSRRNKNGKGYTIWRLE